MNEALKFRLVGAAVLLIGLGLLWPLLFDYDEAMQPEFADLDMTHVEKAIARIDPPTTVKEHLVSNAASQETAPVETDSNAADSSQARESPVQAKSVQIETETISKEQAVETAIALDSEAERPPSNRVTSVVDEAQAQLDAQGIPIAYVVQLGTFSSWKNADQLRNRLNEQGYRAYVRPEASTQPGPYRVQVGPVMTFALAQQLNSDLKKELNLADTFIRRFAHHAGEFSTTVQ